MKIKLIGINARFTHSCLALFYLRHELERHLPEAGIELCQYTINDPYYLTLQRIAEGRPDYVMFSSVIWNSELVSSFAADLLLLDENCRCIIGGPQAEVIGAELEARGRVSIFAGNIEAAPQQFYDDLRRTELQARYGGSFLGSGSRQLAFPYRYDDFAGPLRDRHIYYESSRGCPFSCSYCLSSAEKGLFHKDLGQVFAELGQILQHDPPVLRFVDRTFNDRPERACAIWQFLAASPGRTLFHFEIAPDRFTEEMFRLLETIPPGHFQFEIGIQSTNSKTLAAIRRPMDPQAAAETISRLRSFENIHLHADLILGLPHETVQSFCASINDLFSMRPHYIQMGLLKVLPDTPIAGMLGEYGYTVSRRPPYSLLASRWIEAEGLRELYLLGECLEKCVNNRFFVSFWHYLVQRQEDMAQWFLQLSQRFAEAGYFWKAATQETLSGLLQAHCRHRPDGPLLSELLRYDWLRCGHRYLPEHLQEGESPEELRRRLFHELPDEMSPLYDRKTRSHFFKKALFQTFSRECLQQIGYEMRLGRAVICFVPEREDSVDRLQKTMIVAEYAEP